MKNKLLSDNFKSMIKQCLVRSLLLRRFIILLYKLLGRRPWSLGYSVYKYNFIKEIIEKQLHIFNEEKLTLDYGFRMDERVVEYPWFFSRLKDSELTILDAGSGLNHFEILKVRSLRNRKLYITTLSNEGFQNIDNAPTYVYEDLRDMCYKDNFFDAVVSISTLEHIGMDNTFLYSRDEAKKENVKYAYLDAIREFKRVLKEGGVLYLTMPYGQYKNHNWFQVFDSGMIIRIIEEFSPSRISETYFKYENNQWNFSNALSCKDGYYFDIHNEPRYRQDNLAASQSVACLELVK